MSKRKIMIGTDPEYFMARRDSKKLVSAIPFIKGGKHDPIKLPSGASLQSDNVAVEFATPPANDSKDFINKLKTALTETYKSIPAGYDLIATPSAKFDPEELKDPKACEFGCMPDYCAWEMKVNEPPMHEDATFRSCGGHIHVGCLDENGELISEDTSFLLEVEGKVKMVKGMDLFHGIISTVLDSSPEAVERRTLYGKAGCHRPTEYGVEYRALSNYWTKTPYSSMLMSSLTDDVIDVILTGELDGLIEEVGSEDIRRIINTGNVEDAKAVIEKVLYKFMSKDSKFYFDECIEKLNKATDMAKEWSISI
jgi:hypothetical protein